MRISVTAGDIRRATPGPTTCPIARACRRAGVDVVVLDRTMRLQGTLRYVTLPQEAREFVEVWDRHRNGTPFTFEIRGLGCDHSWIPNPTVPPDHFECSRCGDTRP